MALFASKIGSLFVKRNPAIPIMIGLTLTAFGYLLLLRLDASQSYWIGLFPTMLIIGFGFAFTLPPIYMQAVLGIKETEQGLASGLLNTSFQIGGAVSLAIIAAVMSAGDAPLTPGELLPNMALANQIIAAIAIVGVIFTIPRLWHRA